MIAVFSLMGIVAVVDVLAHKYGVDSRKLDGRPNL